MALKIPPNVPQATQCRLLVRLVFNTATSFGFLSVQTCAGRIVLGSEGRDYQCQQEMFGILEICFLLFLFLFLARIRFSDCDALLHFYEKFAIKPEPRIRGKVVWITGASSGIGEYLAYKLTQCGCKLVLSARRKDELERVKARCLGTYRCIPEVPNYYESHRTEEWAKIVISSPHPSGSHTNLILRRKWAGQQQRVGVETI